MFIQQELQDLQQYAKFVKSLNVVSHDDCSLVLTICTFENDIHTLCLDHSGVRCDHCEVVTEDIHSFLLTASPAYRELFCNSVFSAVHD
ncbi:hypothetical protein GEMRC1_000823 [Eukaryota sp. GEM-RC1]